MNKILVIIFVLFTSCKSEAKDDVHIGDYLKLQYAGNIGFGAIGIGKYFFDEKYELELFYGHVPSFIANKSINIVSIKNNYVPYSFMTLDSQFAPYIGMGFIHLLGKEYFATEIKSAPEGYYNITGVHLSAYAGISLKHEFDSENTFSFYLEVGTIDTYVVSYFSNLNSLDFKEIWSLALGIGYHY